MTPYVEDSSLAIYAAQYAPLEKGEQGTGEQETQLWLHGYQRNVQSGEAERFRNQKSENQITTHLHELFHGFRGKRVGAKQSVGISCERKTEEG